MGLLLTEVVGFKGTPSGGVKKDVKFCFPQRWWSRRCATWPGILSPFIASQLRIGLDLVHEKYDHPVARKAKSCARTKRSLVSEITSGSKSELGSMPTPKVLGLKYVTVEGLVPIDSDFIAVVPYVDVVPYEGYSST
jgi:hypothetical protein